MDQNTEIPKPHITILSPDLKQKGKEAVKTALKQSFRGRERVWRHAGAFDSPTIRRLSLHLAFLSLFTGIVLTSAAFDNIKNPPNFQPVVMVMASENQPLAVESAFEGRLFTNFSPEERKVTAKEIAKQIELYKKSGDQSRIDRVLDWEKTTIKPILDLDVRPEDHQFWKELLSAIVYVESEGKHLAESNIGALGLAQLTQNTAEGTAKKHGILKFDLKKGWDNLRLSRFLLEDLMERFGPDLTLLGYYGGQPFADQKVLVALEKRGISNDQQLRSYIDHFQINIANLGSEDGKEYLRKIVAAHRILKEAKTG